MSYVRGLETRHEQNPGQLIRDTRTLGRRIYDFFADGTNAGIVLFCLAALGFFLPALVNWLFILGLVIYLFARSSKLSLPFRLPQRANMPDFNDPKPGSGKPNSARGIYYFGNDKMTNEELWFNNEDMRTHVLVFGSTGSGKTEFLVSLAFNALVQSSGFIYVDGKGDNSLFSKVFSMARSVGREDDLLLINFMTGARDIVGPQAKRLSNTLNPFSTGSSSMLAQLVVSLMDSSAQTPDGDMWKGRAISFVEALMRTLVYARDQDYILLDAHTVRKYFTLDKIESIAIDRQLPRQNEEPADLSTAPESVIEPLINYLDTLPGYDKSRKGKQGSQTLEQHGFITMQLTRTFTSLADTYGHIIRTDLAEVDMRDVVLNRRILVVLLPALEKSPDELSNLGKVIIATLKAMMAAGLGDEVEGDYRDLILRKPTNARTPFLCILDEYGYYSVQGFAVVPAQARSLGFSAVFAGQDLPAFQKSSKEEAASIGANTNIKMAMKLEDPTETWEFFMKTAGEAYVTKVDSFQTLPSSITNTYMDTRSSSIEKRQRIDLLDLKDQGPGEAHIFFKSKIVRMRVFFANPDPVPKMRLNQFLRVAIPQEDMLVDLEKQLAKFAVLVDNEHLFDDFISDAEEIDLVADTYENTKEITPIERGVTALLAYHNKNEPEQITEEEEIDELSAEELNIFCKIRMHNRMEHDLLTDDFATFSLPMLNKAQTQPQIQMIERLAGHSENHARNVAQELIKDMSLATYYPPDIKERLPVEDLTALIEKLIIHVDEKSSSGGFDDDFSLGLDDDFDF